MILVEKINFLDAFENVETNWIEDKIRVKGWKYFLLEIQSDYFHPWNSWETMTSVPEKSRKSRDFDKKWKISYFWMGVPLRPHITFGVFWPPPEWPPGMKFYFLGTFNLCVLEFWISTFFLKKIKKSKITDLPNDYGRKIIYSPPI